MKNCSPHFRNSAFTLIELLAVMAILIILSILSYSGLQWMTAQSRATSCINNLRQVSGLMINYLADHRQVYPLSVWKDTPESSNKFWADAIVNHSGDRKNLEAFICPGVKRSNIAPDLRDLKGATAYVSYGINRYGVSPTQSETPWLHPAVQTVIEHPSKLLLLVEMEAANQPWDGWYWAHYSIYETESNIKNITDRHKTMNALFCDGHVETIDVATLIAQPITNYPWGTYKYTLYQ